jgi:hypothetical protein
MYEHISAPVIPKKQFQSRVLRSTLLGVGLITFSLAIGMAGFLYFFPKLDWADAFVNTAMLLSGMGPLAQPETTGAKLFAGCYALYSGLMLLIAAGVVFAPVIHRFLHKMHVDEDEQSGRKKSK